MRRYLFASLILFSSFAAAAYDNVLAEIKQYQQMLVTGVSAGEKIAENEKIAKIIYENIYKKVIPHWYGTPWSFSGHTVVPQDGTIACGYFVSTVLRHAGFKVERVRLAQQASEHIILSLVTNNYVKRFRNVKLERFINTIENWGKGIYIVGLDNHVGFLVHDGKTVYFIHSSYVWPSKVVKEKARNSMVLAWSRYRVVGKITADPRLLKKWLYKSPIGTKTGSS